MPGKMSIRKERFCEGHLAAVCESGLMLSTAISTLILIADSVSIW